MPKRKGLSNKIRFEVFKRDSFRCQYCGATAPEVLLQVDHIKPVANGGTNNIINLITSCAKCNSGKGARELNDNSEMEKQRAQLDELNERRAQLEMMFQWRDGLSAIEDDMTEKIIKKICRKFKCQLSEHGLKRQKKCIRDNGISDTLEAIDVCAERYLEKDANGGFVYESVELALKKLPSVARFLRTKRENPDLARVLYIRGILRNRCYRIPYDCVAQLVAWQDGGLDLNYMEEVAKEVKNWNSFSEAMNGSLPLGGEDAF